MGTGNKFFVSFNSADRDKAAWIAWTLSNAGHEVAVHTWELPAGGDIPTWMNERLAWADRLIAVVSPDYLAGRYSVSEWTAKVWGDPDGDEGTVVPVIVRPTPEMPPLLAKLSHVDLTGLGEAEAQAMLLKRLRAPAPPRKKPVFQPVPPADREHSGAAKPQFSQDAFVRDPRSDVLAGSSSAAAHVLNDLVRQLAEPAIAERLADSEKRQLKSIIRDLGLLAFGQSAVVERLKRAAQNRDADTWKVIQSDVARVAGKVSELVSFLERFEGDIIFKDLNTFSELQSMTLSRAGIYTELRAMPAPTTPEGWDRLMTIISRIEELLSQIPGVQERLSDYLAVGNGS